MFATDDLQTYVHGTPPASRLCCHPFASYLSATLLPYSTFLSPSFPSLLPSPSLSLPTSFPLPPYLPPSTPQFQLSRDYSTSGDHPLSLKKGDVVEVLDNKIEERWFVRTQSASPEAGWVPPTVLMPIGRDEADGRSSKTIITSGEPVLLFVTVPFWSTNHSP